MAQETKISRDECYDSPCRELPKDLAGVLREELEAQSGFCSLMGSLLGNYLWDLSKCPHIACTLANKSRIQEVLEVTRSAVMCYSSACRRNRDAWPAGISPDETRLTLSLVGLLANLAAVAPGILVSYGDALFKDVIRAIPEMPAEPLKKVLVDFLYNVSLDELGAARLMTREAMKAVTRALTSQPDIRLSGLRLLASLTSRDVPPILINQVPLEKVKTLYQTGDVEMSHYAKMVMNNMAKLEQDL